ncbi:unnamed protein product [Rhizophagus irregularis]|nr:unnamed protein product [Rhizophagus irregularis]
MISTIILSFGIYDIFYLLITFIIIYVTHYYYRYFTRLNPLPGPFPIPFLGNVHQKIGYEYSDWLKLMHKKYGDIFEINFVGQRSIILCRTEFIENMNIPTTKTKYPFRFHITEGLTEYGYIGTGLVNNNDHKSWKYNRQFFSQAMMTPSFNHQSIEWTNELWNEMEFYWNKLGEDYELDFIKWMLRFTNEIIFKISTGKKNNSIACYYNSLIPENFINLSENENKKIKNSEDFIHSIETLVDGLIYFVIFNKFMRHYVPFIRGKINGFLKNRDYLFERISNIIKERKIEIENTPLDQPLRHDMLTSFITANTSRDINSTKHGDVDLLRPMTDKEIFGNILDAINGGTDTTANLLCFVVYYLGHYPEVKQRLRQELDEVLGNDLMKPINYNNIEKLYYCDAVIKEVYRHSPITFFIGRINVEKDEVGGFNWPEGTSFHILYSEIMMSKDYWTNPENFDPYRFYKIDENYNNNYLLENQHIKNSFTIFGGGIRICPGRKLAMIELKCLLALIYRKYDIELADINSPLKYESGLFTTCKELIVKIKSRKF